MDAAIYARYSSHNQREESIEDQVRVCRAEAERQGYNVVHIYADSAISGRTDERPEFQRMLADAGKKSWNAVFIYKMDRFARNRYDSAIRKAELKQKGIKLISATEHVPEGPEGVLLESLLEGMAEYYSRNLAENVRRGMEGNAMKCNPNGRPLAGYVITNGHYEPDPDTAPLVRMIFEMYADGATMRECIEATPELRTSTGHVLTASTISKMLRNESYMGTFHQMGIRIEGGMPAIVPEHVFKQVQSRLQANKHGRQAPLVERYPLSGKLVDEHGNVYVGVSGTSKGGKRYRYYMCKASNHRLPQPDVDERVSHAVAKVVGRPDALERITSMIMLAQERAESGERAQMAVLQAQLDANHAEQERIVDAIAKIGLNDSMEARIKTLEDEALYLREELASVRVGAPHITPDMVEFWVSQLFFAEPAAVLATFVSRVVVADDGTLRVEFHLLEEPDETLDEHKTAGENDQSDSVLGTEQKSEHVPAAGEGTCSHMFPMVGTRRQQANTGFIVAIPRGFAIIAA